MPEPRGNWSQTELAGHDVHVYEPPEPSEHRFTVVYLHGVHVNGLRDKAVFGRQFDRHGLRVVCPRTARSWWTDKICQEFDSRITAERYVVDEVVGWIGRQWDARPPRIALLGTSMGGQGALRLAFKYPDTFPIVAAISPAIDFHTRWDEGDEVIRAMYPNAEAARQETATLYLRPLYWPRHTWFCCDPTDHRWHESAERLEMKLVSLGVLHECDLETIAGGHGFAYYNAMAERSVGFLAERLESERLRIV